MNQVKPFVLSIAKLAASLVVAQIVLSLPPVQSGVARLQNVFKPKA